MPFDMNSREKVYKVISHQKQYGVFWTGNPDPKTIPVLAKAWGIEPTYDAVYEFLQDDCRWINADSSYENPEGYSLFDPSIGIGKRQTLSAEGCFAYAETLADIESYPWPKTEYCHFEKLNEQLEKYQDKMIFSGLWSHFFHIVADFFGMENYFIKMYENPLIVEAVTEKVVDFYVEANEKYFTLIPQKTDIMFFGNDFGTQRDLILSPENFRRFILPSIKRLIAVGKKHGQKIMMHSCGSIYRIIPDLIDAGVDILHPIQAGAFGMDAVSLRQFKNDLAFVGGIDAQSFFVNSTPQQIKDEVYRVREILSPALVVSPSHEAILPNVPPENILAMIEAARESI
jgi:uroporphyrinogen decarboxylase